MSFFNFFFDTKKPALTLIPVCSGNITEYDDKFPESVLKPVFNTLSKALKPLIISSLPSEYTLPVNYLLVNSLLTVNFFLPLALRLASTFLPSFDFILSLNPCLFFLFLILGWYVLFTFYPVFLNIFNKFDKNRQLQVLYQEIKFSAKLCIINRY